MTEEYVKLRCKGNMYEPTLRAIEEAREDSRVLHTQLQDNGEEIFLKIPINEAGAWIQILEVLADEEYDDDLDASLFDDLATIITEEAEKIRGVKPPEKELAGAGYEKHRNFWRGI